MITDAAFGYVCDKQLLSQSQYSTSNYKYIFGYHSNSTIDDRGIWNNTAWGGMHVTHLAPEICFLILYQYNDLPRCMI